LASQILLISLFPALPNVDGPHHKYSAWVYSEILKDPSSHLGNFFEPRDNWLYPNAAYSFFLVKSSRWMTLDGAEKLGYVLYLIGLALAFDYFCSSFGNYGRSSRYLLLTLTLNYLFFMGFLNFLWGAVFAIWSIGLVERMTHKESAWSLILPNIALLLTFWAHLMAFALGLLGIAVLGIFAPPKRWPWHLTRCLPALAIALFFWPASASIFSNWQYRDTYWTRLERIFSLRVATSFGEAEWLPAAIWGVMLLILILAAGFATRLRKPVRRLYIFFIVLLVAAVVVPRGAGAGFFLDDRVSWFFWLIGLSLISFAAPRTERVLICSATVLALIQVGYLSWQLREFNRQHELFISGTEHMLRGSPVFTYTPRVKHVPGVVWPWESANARYSLALESPDLFFYQADERHSSHFPIRYAKAAQGLFPGEKPPAKIAPGEVASFAHYVVLWGELGTRSDSLTTGLRYKTLFVDGPLEVLIRPHLLVSHRLEELRARPSEELRKGLVEVLLSQDYSPAQPVLDGRLFSTNLSPDRWTFENRPGGLLAVNDRHREVEFDVRLGSVAASGARPLTLTLHDGRSAQNVTFESGQAKWVSLGVIPPQSKRLIVFWTDTCQIANEEAQRCLGVRLLRGRERVH
jgi:hypothetical protein